MVKDPKARTMTLSYTGGTVSAAQGLLEYLFGEQAAPTWGGGSIGTTQLGRKRYKYGTRQKTNAAAGQSVFLDCGDDGVYSVRVTGNIVDFIDKVVAKTGETVKRAYTRRGTIYGPTSESI
jgi:hypothetical protein